MNKYYEYRSLAEFLEYSLASDLISKGESYVISQLGGVNNYNKIVNYIIEETEKNETIEDLIRKLKESIKRLKEYENEEYN